MGWVHAFLVSAKMITLKMFWNRSKEEFIGKAVSVLLASVRHSIASVSSAMSSGSPYPASGTPFDDNFVLKTLRQSVKVNTQHRCPHGSRNAVMGAIFS
jgi:hypothetical protein